MLRLALAVSFAVLSAACALPPCAWDYKPATCGLKRVELRPTKTAEAVMVAAIYEVRASSGVRTFEVSAFQVIPEGTSRDVLAGKVIAYFERHPDLPCTAGHLTKGTCAREDVKVTLAGCRDQRANVCYDLAPDELK